MVVKKLAKSGHSLVVALPPPMLKRLWLMAGDYVKLEDVVEGILIKPLDPRGSARPNGASPVPRGKKNS